MQYQDTISKPHRSLRILALASLVFSLGIFVGAQETSNAAPTGTAPNATPAAAPAAAPTPAAKKKFEPSVKVNGFAFIDLYYVAQAATNISNGAVAKIKTADQRGLINTADLGTSEGRYGFQARRVVVGIDGLLSETIKSRVSFIAQQPYYNTNGAVSSLADNTVLSIFEAYASWDYLVSSFGNQNITFGIQNTPSWKVADKIWGYRPVEKTVQEFFGLRLAKDFGAALKGNLFKGVVNYDLMLGNGNFIREAVAASNDTLPKVFYGNIGAAIPLGTMTTAKGLVVTNELAFEAYGDANLVSDSAKSLWSLQFTLGLVTPILRIGGSYSLQTSANTNTTTMVSVPLFFSFSEAFKIKDVGFGLFGRFDLRSQDPLSFQNYNVVAGLDISPVKYLSIMPNVEVFMYQYAGIGTDHVADIVPRLTVRFSF